MSLRLRRDDTPTALWTSNLRAGCHAAGQPLLIEEGNQNAQSKSTSCLLRMQWYCTGTHPIEETSFQSPEPKPQRLLQRQDKGEWTFSWGYSLYDGCVDKALEQPRCLPGLQHACHRKRTQSLTPPSSPSTSLSWHVCVCVCRFYWYSDCLGWDPESAPRKVCKLSRVSS